MKKKIKYKRRIEKRKRVLKFLLFILIIILLYLFAFKSNFFNVKSIKVVGNRKISYDQVVKASMCNKGENIFKINLRKGRKSLERLPYIREARIKRKLPKEIIIKIDERREVAIINYIGSFIYIDKEGHILAINNKTENRNLPQIFGLKLDDPQIGDNLYQLLEEKEIEEFLVYNEQLNLLSKMKYINFSQSNIMIELKKEIKVVFGPLDNIKYKLSFLNKILEDIQKKDIKVKQILLNKGDNPIVVTEDR